MNTSHQLDLERLDAISDARAVGDPISADDRAYWESFQDTPEARAEAMVEAELLALGQIPGSIPGSIPESEAGPPSLRDERIVAAVAAPPASRWGQVLTWSLPAAAAAALVLLAWPADGPDSMETSREPLATLPAAPDLVEVDMEVAPAAQPEGWRTADGTAAARGERRALADGRCLTRGVASVCGEDAASVEVGHASVTVHSGAVRVASSEPLKVVAGDALVEVAGDATISVQEVVVVMVVAGRARVERADTTQDLAAGDEWSSAVAVAPAVDRSDQVIGSRRAPAELLREAQDARIQGNLEEASAAYSRLVRHHGASPEAHAALPSLGRVELERGRARAALRAFDRYLRHLNRGAQNAEEARLGRVQALRKLGKKALARQAAQEFLREHPDSPHAASLRREP